MYQHQSASSFCQLCAAPNDAASPTNLYSRDSEQHSLVALLDLYISPIVPLPKVDRLCVCDTCKARLLAWDSFINSCKEAQQKLKYVHGINQQTIDPTENNHGNINSGVSSLTSSSKKRRSSNYCIARWCNTANHQGISLFRLPRERDRALQWLAAAERTDLQCMTVLHSYYLCANHFTSDMFTNKACNQLLKKATPSIFPKPPYANKMALKAASSQIFPTTLRGLLVKTILPKTSSSNDSAQHAASGMVRPQKLVVTTKNLAVPKDSLIFNLPTQGCQGEASAVTELSSSSISNATSELSEHVSPATAQGAHLKVLNSTPALVMNENSNPIAVLSRDDNTTGDCSVSLSAVGSIIVKENSSILQYGKVLASCGQQKVIAYQIPPTESSSNCFASVSSHDKSKTTVWLQDDDSKNTTNSVTARTQQKQYLEEFESCLSADTFIRNKVSPVNKCTDDSGKTKVLKRTKSSIPGDCSPVSRSEAFDSQSQSRDNYLSSVGSQDFLLPHVPVELDSCRSSPMCSVSSFPLRADSADVIIQAASKEQTASAADEINPHNASLFDLQADPTQEIDNSTFINNIENLVELMDFDHYFEGR